MCHKVFCGVGIGLLLLNLAGCSLHRLKGPVLIEPSYSWVKAAHDQSKQTRIDATGDLLVRDDRNVQTEQ